MHRADDIHIDVGGDLVVGKRHAVPDGRVCVHILGPFGECAADSDSRVLDGPAPERQFLLRLYEVCCWAEANATTLAKEDAKLRSALADRPGLLRAEAVTEALAALDDADGEVEDRMDAIAERWSRYETEHYRRAGELAATHGCPWPDVAGSCWQLLSQKGFYRAGRCPLTDADAS